MLTPRIIIGNNHKDERGIICFNNSFNLLEVKRSYTIQNIHPDFVRAWQGHRVEQRWFSAVSGAFQIKAVAVDNWDFPAKDSMRSEFILSSENLNILHIPAGYVTSIQALELNSKLLVYADYQLGELQDEFRFAADYFN